MSDHMQDLIDALRSGEYDQGNDRLRTSYNEFCCLGVAADVFIKANPGAGVSWEYDDVEPVIIDHSDQADSEQHDCYAPAIVCEWFGLSPDTRDFVSSKGDDVIPSMKRQGLLAEWNDAGESFEDIARRLEADDFTHHVDEDADNGE